VHARPTRILFESTGTLASTLTTGIQRVVRSLLREALRSGDGGPISAVPVVFRNGNFYDATRHWRRIIRRQARHRYSTRQRMKVAIERFSCSAAELYDGSLTRLHKLLYPKSLVRAAGRAYWHTAGRRIVFNDSDVLLLLDASWGHPIWPAVNAASGRGCRVGAVIYDLLPVEYPQFFEQAMPAVFADWLENLIDHSEFFLAISETVRAALESYVRSSRPAEEVAAGRFHSFRLGADMPRPFAGGGVRPALRRLFQDGHDRAPYLAVGTIEPRKNHHYLLDAFEILWRSCPSARLCIVGRVGWECSDVRDRIARHPRRNTSLFAFHDLSDKELHFCYERAKSLVSASFAEGFGLPLIEAACHSLPAFASDIPVHREVGRQHCSYFDLQSPASLASLLGDVERRGTCPRNPRSRQELVIPWSESYRDLLNKTLQVQSRACGAKPEEKVNPLRPMGRVGKVA
jgi:alpha-1,2-rhamnosyltransferase